MSQEVKKAAGPPREAEYLTVKEACALLKISRPTLYSLGRKIRPRLKRVRIGRSVRIPRSEIDRAAAQMTRELR